MKALNLHGIGDLRYEDVPDPVCQENEVLVKVRAAGICGSDIPRVFTNGTYHFPTIIGHEFAGEIVEAKEADLLGRRVTVFPLLPCHQCAACAEEHYAQCAHYSYYGSRQDGGMAEYLAVKRENLAFLPDNVLFSAAAMTEPSAVALHAFRRSGAKAGDTMLIYGIGTIALLLAQIAQHAGIRPVLAGRSEAKKRMAEKLGFSACNIRAESLNDMLGENGADSCIEATGAEEGLTACIRHAKNFASVVLLGNPIGAMNLLQKDYWLILRHELCVIGTWNSDFSQHQNDWRDVLDFMQQGVICPEKLITHRFALKDYQQAFTLMHEKKEPYLKVMFIL